MKVVVIGGSGTMGAASGAVFAAAGLPVTLLARTLAKAAAGKARAEKLLKQETAIAVGTYDDDLAREVGSAELVFEAVAEDGATKRAVFEEIEPMRRPGAIVATVSSGLSIGGLCRGRSTAFRSHFLGIHFYNPPTVITGCELVPHAGTDPVVIAAATSLLRDKLGRQLVVTRDTPAFCGNRVGFRLLAECTLLAEELGPARVDLVFGAHTGRALPPLATIDLVGWDVHRAIVDNLGFALPAYMERLIARGHLGSKTPERGGYYRRNGTGKDVLDIVSGEHAPPPAIATPGWVRQMRELHAAGRHRDALAVLADADGDAAIVRRTLLGYISYGLSLVGEVVEAAADVDRIMQHGFRWAPPGLLVDLLGARRTLELLAVERMHVPRAVVDAAERGFQLHAGSHAEVRSMFAV